MSARLFFNDILEIQFFQGFESRGATFSSRLSAWNNLMDASKWNGPLTFMPSSIILKHHYQSNENSDVSPRSIVRVIPDVAGKNIGNSKPLNSVTDQGEDEELVHTSNEHFSDGHDHLQAHGFCNSPGKTQDLHFKLFTDRRMMAASMVGRIL